VRALLPTTAVVILAALAFSSIDRSIDRSPVPSMASPAPSSSQPAVDPAGAPQIVLRLSHDAVTASLTDTAAASSSPQCYRCG
jgi:hypothetical protein